MARNVVIRQSDQVALRWGYCDFVADGSYNPGTEAIVNHEQHFNPEVTQGVWVWTGAIFVLYMPTWIPFTPIPGNPYRVGDAKPYATLAAAYAAASPGDTIELYNSTGRAAYSGPAAAGLTLNKANITIVDIDHDDSANGTWLDGNFRWLFQAGATGNLFQGIRFNNFLLSGSHRSAIEIQSTTMDATFERCRFDGTASPATQSFTITSYINPKGPLTFNACHFANSEVQAFIYHSSSVPWRFYNCVFENAAGATLGGIYRVTAGTDIQFWNCAMSPLSAANNTHTGLAGGDYNASPVAGGLPDLGNSHPGITWGNHFDIYANDFYPQSGQVPDLPVLGDPTKAPTYGYLGNLLSAFSTPIGSIPLP